VTGGGCRRAGELVLWWRRLSEDYYKFWKGEHARSIQSCRWSAAWKAAAKKWLDKTRNKERQYDWLMEQHKSQVRTISALSAREVKLRAERDELAARLKSKCGMLVDSGALDPNTGEGIDVWYPCDIEANAERLKQERDELQAKSQRDWRRLRAALKSRRLWRRMDKYTSAQLSVCRSERDELRERLKDVTAAGDALGKEVDEMRERLVETVKALYAERDGLRERLEAAEAEVKRLGRLCDEALSVAKLCNDMRGEEE
jgi:uncharacterized coiled-coil DUF342 family protein